MSEYADLIKLAAEMVRGEGMPTCFDGEFYASTPLCERRRIMKAMADVEERCKVWGIRLRNIADRLAQQHNPQP
jgi:hypothetical protein